MAHRIPQGTVLLSVGGNQTNVSFGPSDDKATLTIDKTLSLRVAANVPLGSLSIDLSEYDDTFCGSNDELDIDPSPTSTNASIDLDLTWDGGIQINGTGLGWYGQPVILKAQDNWITFTVSVAEDP